MEEASGPVRKKRGRKPKTATTPTISLFSGDGLSTPSSNSLNSSLNALNSKGSVLTECLAALKTARRRELGRLVARDTAMVQNPRMDAFKGRADCVERLSAYHILSQPVFEDAQYFVATVAEALVESLDGSVAAEGDRATVEGRSGEGSVEEPGEEPCEGPCKRPSEGPGEGAHQAPRQEGKISVDSGNNRQSHRFRALVDRFNAALLDPPRTELLVLDAKLALEEEKFVLSKLRAEEEGQQRTANPTSHLNNLNHTASTGSSSSDAGAKGRRRLEAPRPERTSALSPLLGVKGEIKREAKGFKRRATISSKPVTPTSVMQSPLKRKHALIE